MTALLTFLVVTAFSYAIYHYAPNRTKDLFELERFRPVDSLADARLTHYDDLRQYADLAAMRGRGDEPEPEFSPSRAPLAAAVRRAHSVSRRTLKASSEKLA
ncbi:hypothetical protein [Nocardia sp. NPDC050793]|uniref:hypothetical protein n=1 Tax=Nocardia sp. NPDC050793 TaxID=3155159 RepID=UPI0034092D3D